MAHLRILVVMDLSTQKALYALFGTRTFNDIRILNMILTVFLNKGSYRPYIHPCVILYRTIVPQLGVMGLSEYRNTC